MICYSILTKAIFFLSIASLVVFVRHFSCFIQEGRLQTTKIETFSRYYLRAFIAEKFSIKQLEILNINISCFMTESEVVWVCYWFEIRTCWEFMVTRMLCKSVREVKSRKDPRPLRLRSVRLCGEIRSRTMPLVTLLGGASGASS